jgi:predicted transcriptional regulator
MEQWYTIGEISRELNIPESTIRRYVITYKEFFPSRNFGGRYPKFHEKAIEIVSVVYDKYAQGKKGEEIREALRREYPVVIDLDGDCKTDEVKRNIKLLDTRREMIDSIKKQNELYEKNINALQVVDRLEAEIHELRELLHHQHTTIANFVKMEENKKGFFKSLFR